jgi:hypothetical protein
MVSNATFNNISVISLQFHEFTGIQIFMFLSFVNIMLQTTQLAQTSWISNRHQVTKFGRSPS